MVNWFKLRFRGWLLAIAFGLIAYFIISAIVFVPFFDFDFIWQPDNVFKVAEVHLQSPSSSYLQPGDIVLTVNDKPARWMNRQLLFNPGQENYQFVIQRDDETLTLTIPPVTPSFSLMRERAASGIVSLLLWAIAALIILFATPQNHEAWQLGLTTLGTAVVLAASEAALFNVPGAWLLSSPFLPVVGIALAHIALLPRSAPPSRHERTFFRISYAVIVVLGLLSFWEILYLAPHGTSFEIRVGISSYEVLSLCLASGALVHVGILVWRLGRIQIPYQRQQLFIVLAFTALAILPITMLTIIPRILLGVSILSWATAIAFLALIPAGYGYVIYRRNYLGLDIFATHTLTWLLLSFLFLPAYAFVYYMVQRQSVWDEFGLLPGGAVLFLFLAFVPSASRQSRGVVERVLYGSSASSPDMLLQLTSTLSADPQMVTLQSVVRKVADFLQVRQAALMLTNHNRQLVAVDHLRVNKTVEIISLKDAASLYNDLQIRPYNTEGFHHFLFMRCPWMDCLAPLKVNGTVVGLLLLGRPVPDGYYNAQQIAFIRQVTGIMAVAVEAIRLFEASRKMSRELMQVRDTERMQLAAQIHDEPLQRISMAASGLGHLATTAEPFGKDLPDEIRTYSQELQATSKRLRDICAGLYPPALKQGAQWAVTDVVYAFREKESLDIVLDMTVPNTLLIPHDLTTAIYHVLTEALNNVGKHAQATKVWVQFAYAQEELTLTVVDNGRDNSITSLSLSSLVRSYHFGIVGMYEQANRVNGELHIRAREDGGTAVSLTIPFADKSAHAAEAGWEQGVTYES